MLDVPWLAGQAGRDRDMIGGVSHLILAAELGDPSGAALPLAQAVVCAPGLRAGEAAGLPQVGRLTSPRRVTLSDACKAFSGASDVLQAQETLRCPFGRTTQLPSRLSHA